MVNFLSLSSEGANGFILRGFFFLRGFHSHCLLTFFTVVSRALVVKHPCSENFLNIVVGTEVPISNPIAIA